MFDKDKARDSFLLQNPDHNCSTRYNNKLKKKKEYITNQTVAVAKWREKYPERNTAHRIVFVAIRNGTLTKQPCEVCGLLRVEAHHEDYNKPLCVRWLCKRHHAVADSSRRISQ